MRRVWIANIRKYAIIDDEDYDRVSRYRWYAVRGGGRYYLQTRLFKNGKRIRISMQRLIMGRRKVFFIDGNRFNFRKANFSFYQRDVKGKMAAELRGFILGTLLGDGSVRIYKNKYGERRFALEFGHGDKQRDYIFHKAKLLSAYVTTKPKRFLNRGFGESHYLWRFSTRTASDLDFLNMCYNKKGKKYVSQKWVDSLTITSLAYWYMDDGCLSDNRRIYFCTHSFSRSECDRLVEKLQKMGFPARAETLKGQRKHYPVIRMDYWSSKKFLDQIGRLIVDCLKYKSDIIDAHRKVKCYFCGKEILASGRRSDFKYPACSNKDCKRSARRRKDKATNREYDKKYYAKNRQHICERIRKRRAEKRRAKKAG